MATRKTLRFEDFRRIGLTLPDVEEGTAWGVPALRCGGKVLACVASHRSAESGSIVVMVPVETRDALVTEQPDLYYLRDHYVAYPCVLVRLPRIGEDALRDLLLMGQRFVAAGRTSARPGRPRRSKRTGPASR